MLNNLKSNPERAIEMMKTFKRDGISHKPGKSLNLVIEWQDIVGRSTMTEIEYFFCELAEDRYKDTFHFINMNCLDNSTATEILKRTTLKDELQKARKAIRNEYQSRLDMMDEQIKHLHGEVDEARKASLSHQDTICDMEVVKKADDRSMRIMSEDIDHLRASNHSLSKKAEELDTVKKAFAILNK